MPTAFNGNIQQICTGYTYTCVLLGNGTMVCWGDNSNGVIDLASAGPGSVYLATKVDVGDTVKQMACAKSHVCALLQDETIKCWGINTNGELGMATDTVTATSIPNRCGIDVDGYSTSNALGALSAGFHHTCALLQDGKVRFHWTTNTIKKHHHSKQ